MGKKLVKVTRGFGYWCWKPQVILQSLRQINDGDILIYVDIGCEFVPNKASSLLQKLKELENNDIMGFSLSFPESQWTKGDIFRHFGVENDIRFAQSKQICATIIFMKKSTKTTQIITEWLNVFKNHWHLIDDSPSIAPNHKDFIENRHDQSIWSMINKKYGLKNFDDYYSDKESYGILDSRERNFTMAMYLYLLKNRKYAEVISSVTVTNALKWWLKIGGKILPTSKARKNCRKLLGLRIALK